MYSIHRPRETPCCPGKLFQAPIAPILDLKYGERKKGKEPFFLTKGRQLMVTISFVYKRKVKKVAFYFCYTLNHALESGGERGREPCWIFCRGGGGRPERRLLIF